MNQEDKDALEDKFRQRLTVPGPVMEVVNEELRFLDYRRVQVSAHCSGLSVRQKPTSTLQIFVAYNK